MTQEKFPWLRVLYAVGINLPPVKDFIRQSVSGLDRHPELVRMIGDVQRLDPSDCLICRAHEFAKSRGLSERPEPVDHWCPKREKKDGVELCGCGRPAVRWALYKDQPERRVCQEFPGCLPKQASFRSSKRKET